MQRVRQAEGEGEEECLRAGLVRRDLACRDAVEELLCAAEARLQQHRAFRDIQLDALVAGPCSDLPGVLQEPLQVACLEGDP